MRWVRANIPPGEIVFNTDWDDFPRMFYFDPTHRYVSGLDPTYLYDRNPELSKLYDQITLGDEEDPGPLIRERFGAHYVFTDTSHQDFYNNAVNSGWFEVVHEERDCIVLRLREQKVEPPPEQNDNDNSDSSDAGNDNSRPK